MKQRLEILQQIFSSFQCAAQWITSHPDNYARYMIKAETLIEILEVADCGSIGGYDKSNLFKTISGCKLYDRFLTVLRKEHNEEALKPECGFTVDKLTQFYLIVSKLRNDIS